MKKLKPSERWGLFFGAFGAAMSGVLLIVFGLQYWWACLIIGFGAAGFGHESYLKTAAREKIIDGT